MLELGWAERRGDAESGLERGGDERSADELGETSRTSESRRGGSGRPEGAAILEKQK
jgi:hypothetical protein